MIELRQQLDKERSVRMMLEEQVCPAGLAAGSKGKFWAVHQQTNAPQGRQGTRGQGKQPKAPSAHKASLPIVEGDKSFSCRLIGTLFGGPLVPGEAEGDCPTGAAPAAGTGEATAARGT